MAKISDKTTQGLPDPILNSKLFFFQQPLNQPINSKLKGWLKKEVWNSKKDLEDLNVL